MKRKVRTGYLIPLMFLAAFCLSLAVNASASEIRPYDKGQFQQAQETGKTILVDVYASWCPTCRSQAKAIESLAKDEAFANVVIFQVNFDTDKEVLRELNVPNQSALIVFKGKSEVARSMGVTDPAKIRSQVKQGI